MILDYRNQGPNELRFERGLVKVDGRVVGQVFYVDTERGIVKTYDVLGDKRAHATREFASLDKFHGRMIEAPIDGCVSETLTGKIELYDREGRPFRELAIDGPAAARETR